MLAVSSRIESIVRQAVQATPVGRGQALREK